MMNKPNKKFLGDIKMWQTKRTDKLDKLECMYKTLRILLGLTKMWCNKQTDKFNDDEFYCITNNIS